jgi:hypothetical protein
VLHSKTQKQCKRGSTQVNVCRWRAEIGSAAGIAAADVRTQKADVPCELKRLPLART